MLNSVRIAVLPPSLESAAHSVVFSHFGLEDRILVLIVPLPGHYLYSYTN